MLLHSSRVFTASVIAFAAAAFSACAAGDGVRDGETDEEVGPAPYVPPTGTPAPTNTTTPTPTTTAMPTAMPTTMPPVGSTSALGAATMTGAGNSTNRYQKADVARDGRNYFFMANGWGPGFESQTISWSGTSFTVQSMQGTQGQQYQPASYPTVFCGVYSDSQSRACGLPAALASLTTLKTGWRWRPNTNTTQQYNAAYDIWMGNGTARNNHSGFLMVWYREPVGQQPAGSLALRDVTVMNVPGTWDIWTGAVGGRPIINWVRKENQDTLELEFDIMDFVRDAQQRNLTVPGTHVLSVAVGFEIWNGPITNLESVDFYVDPR
jgi:hypothetical protein